VSNAALVEHVPLPEITPDHYDRTFTLNAKAPLFFVQKMLPMMGSGGSIILVSSAMHYMGLANHSTYAATKAALRSYSRILGGRVQGQRHPREHAEPGRRRHADARLPRRPRPRKPPRFVRGTPTTLLC
jgi:NADP-dependent 3-hydroxy acid dehydrogenase YdfG